MRLSLLRSCLLIALVTGFIAARGQGQTFDGCISYNTLLELHRSDVHSMGQLLGKQRFFMVSSENGAILIHQNDTLRLDLCNWQFAQGFNDIYINAFYKEGFSNYIEYNTTVACANKLMTECRKIYQEQYGDSVPAFKLVFDFQEGHKIIFPVAQEHQDLYLIQCYNPTNLEQLVRLNKTQQEQLQIARQIKEQTILHHIAAADSLAKIEEFPAAISLLEEVYDILPEYISTIDAKLGFIKKQYKEKKIQTYTEQGQKLYNAGDFEAAMEMYSKVLKEDINNKYANEQIAVITRKIEILHQRGLITYEYHEVNPTNYSNFRSALEKEMNSLVDNTQNGNLKLDFVILFDTSGINQSYYNILSFNTISVEKNRPVLESRMSSLLGDGSLQPSFKEDIPIRSTANFHIDMDWRSFGQEIVKNRKRIVNKSPYDIDPDIMDMLENDQRMYYGTYHFQTKNKSVNGRNYNDISLTKYKTVGGEAFFYGLIPGLGTLIATQGKEGAANMALTLICYGGAATAFGLFRSFDQQYKAKAETLSEEDAKSLNTKREICKWSSIAGISIGGVLHLSGMIKAMVRGVQNKKASKELRKALHDEPIEISKENIKIQ